MMDVFTKKDFGQYENGIGTLRAAGGDLGGGSENLVVEMYQDVVGALCATDYKGVKNEVVEQNKLIVQPAYAIDCRNATIDADKNGTLQSDMVRNVNSNNVVMEKKGRYIVRRLTPMECERLQGYPDHWTDMESYTDTKGKNCKVSETARYKALGNSIALPSWKYVLKKIAACYERDATMASLFDGIGGFPLLWEQINGKGSCLWASEIEEFPIAVTKNRIGDQTDGT